jgi:hypothetical protein
MMNPTTYFRIQSGVVFSWIIKGIDVIKEQGAMVGPHITFVANVAWIVIGIDGSCSLWLYDQIFKALFEFLFEELLLVFLVYA